MYAAVKTHDWSGILIQLQNLKENMVDNLYNNYTFTETHIALVLDLSAQVATDAGDGDLGDGMERAS